MCHISTPAGMPRTKIMCSSTDQTYDLLQALYDYSVVTSHAAAAAADAAAPPQLHIADFDAEQIWGQLDMQSGPLLRCTQQPVLLCQPVLNRLSFVQHAFPVTMSECQCRRRVKRLIGHVGDAAALLQPQADAQLDGGPAHSNGCVAYPLGRINKGADTIMRDAEMRLLVPPSALQNGHMGGASGGSSSEDEGAGRDGAGGAQAKDDSESEDEDDFEEDAAADEPDSTRRWDANRSKFAQAETCRAYGRRQLHAHPPSQVCHRVRFSEPADADGSEQQRAKR
jgi:hypothetical protein